MQPRPEARPAKRRPDACTRQVRPRPHCRGGSQGTYSRPMSGPGLIRIAAVLLSAVVLAACTALTERPDPPHVTLAGLQLTDVNLFEQRYRLTLRVQNPNAVDLPVEGMSYELFVNDREFARGVSPRAVTVPAYGEALMEVDVVSSLANVVAQLQDLGQERETISYRLEGGVSLRGLPGKIPFSHEGDFALPGARTAR